MYIFLLFSLEVIAIEPFSFGIMESVNWTHKMVVKNVEKKIARKKGIECKN